MSLASILEAPSRIASAIRKASQATGADFDYLLKTAARESRFKEGAKAKTSSAAGLFQFIEGTWLKMVKDVGPQIGLTDFAQAIQETKSGRCYVTDAQAKAKILDLRHDPEISAIMAGAFTQQNADYMAEKLGRQPNDGELYIAHFLGASGGARFVRLADTRPDLRADIYFPRAARANRAIFFDGDKPRTIGQVYQNLIDKHCGTSVQVASALPASREPEASQPRQTVPLFSQTKVASLIEGKQSMTPITMTDAGAGSLGQWRTFVLPEPSAGSSAAVGSALSQAGSGQGPVKPDAPAPPVRAPRKAQLPASSLHSPADVPARVETAMMSGPAITGRSAYQSVGDTFWAWMMSR